MSSYTRLDLLEADYESQDFTPSTSQFYFLHYPLRHSIYESQNFKQNGETIIELAASTFETGP